MSIGNLKDYGNKGNNFPWQLKVLQGLQAIASSTSAPLTCVDKVTVCGTTFSNISGISALNVNVVNPIPLEVIINEANDSILVYGNDGTTNRKIKTDANGELQVDVLSMPAIFKEDTAHVSDDKGAFVLAVRNDTNTAMTSADGDYSPIAVNSAGAVAINDGGNSITVDAVDLDIRNLDCSTDSVAICDGAGNALLIDSNGFIGSNLFAQDPITSNQGPLTFTGTGTANALDVNITNLNLNIRDLDCATDSVSICAGGNPLTSTTIGATTALDVSIVPTNTVLNLQNLEVSGADGDLSSFGPNITSISFFSNGTTNALVSVNGGASFVNVAPGTTINLDANSPSNAYGGTSFFWDTTTNLGSSLIIIYSYI